MRGSTSSSAMNIIIEWFHISMSRFSVGIVIVNMLWSISFIVIVIVTEYVIITSIYYFESHHVLMNELNSFA